VSERRDLPAGVFSAWLHDTRIALLEDIGADVPCDGCTACCTSSYFIHVAPDESETLARVPRELLFAAPDLPAGNVLLGYGEDGHCPMLRDEVCTIYEDRPLTCRNYDCRVYPAAGIAADRPLITQRARRWAFGYPAKEDRDQHSAVRAAARFVVEHAECFPRGAVPSDPAQVAILAVKVYEVFLGRRVDSGTAAGRAAPDREIAEAVVRTSEEFEAGRDLPRAQPGPLFCITRVLTP
jgi:hypothetical protein